MYFSNVINVVSFCIFKTLKESSRLQVSFSLIVVYLFVCFVHNSINHHRVCFRVRLGTLDYNPMMQCGEIRNQPIADLDVVM